MSRLNLKYKTSMKDISSMKNSIPKSGMKDILDHLNIKDKISPSYFTLNTKDIRDVKDWSYTKYHFDEIDLLISRFSWEIFELYRTKKLNDMQIRDSEYLLEKYRVYVQKHNKKLEKNLKYSMSNSSPKFYTPEEKEDVQLDGEELISILSDISESVNISKVPIENDKDGNKIVDRKKIFSDYGLIIPPVGSYRDDIDITSIIRGESTKYEYKEDIKESEIGEISKVEKDTIIRKVQTQIEKKKDILSDKEKKDARELLFGDKKENEQNRQDMFEQIKHQQEDFFRLISQNLNLDKGTGALEVMGTRIDKIEKLNQKMAESILELHEEMIRKQDLSSVSWKNLPNQIRLLFAKGFWNFTIKAISLPITLPSLLVNNILIKPAWYSTKILFEKLYFLWGCFAIFIVVGNVAYVYISNEQYIIEKFSAFMNTDNIFIEAASNYVIYPIETIYGQMAGPEQLIKVWERIGEYFLGSIIHSMVRGFEKFKDYIYSYLRNIIKDQINSYNPFRYWS